MGPGTEIPVCWVFLFWCGFFVVGFFLLFVWDFGGGFLSYLQPGLIRAALLFSVPVLQGSASNKTTCSVGKDN